MERRGDIADQSRAERPAARLCHNIPVNLYDDLLAQIRATQQGGVIDDIADAIYGDIRIFFVRPQTMFDRDSVYQSLSCYIVTSTQLVVVSSDVSYEFNPNGELLTSVHYVDLSQIRDFQVLRRRAFDGAQAGHVTAVAMRIRWGESYGVDTFPAGCDDPTCQADHGSVGRITGDDVEIVVDESTDPQVFGCGTTFIAEFQRILAGVC